MNLWVTSGFIYIFLVGILGLAMRSLFLISLPIPYTNILHAHSHTALLGWAFVMSIYGLINHLGIEKFEKIKWYFLVYTFSIGGMFVSFLYQSYGAMSISFSAFFVFTSYVFLYRLWKLFDSTSVLDTLWKSAIIWFYLSTIGVWCLGPSSAILGKEHWMYSLSIQFFLHFQINGWLLFAVLAMLFKYVKNDYLPTKNTIYLLNLSLVLTFGLNIYWVSQSFVIYFINAIGIILQLFVYLQLTQILWKYSLVQISKTMQQILRFILFALMIKAIIQLATLFPNYSLMIKSNRFLIVAFIHLVLLGFVSFGWVYVSIKEKILAYNKVILIGLGLWILGFIVTESIIASMGYGYSFKYNIQWLWVSSLVMLVGITVLFYQRLKYNFRPISKE